MPHFKCVGCRTRLYSAVAPADLIGDLCPRCGSLLEPVGDLAEIVGFQAIRARGAAPASELQALAAAVARRPNESL